MKHSRRALALLTAAALTLTGCSSLLEHEYIHITPHNAAPTAEGDPSTLRADSYQELVNALIYLVDKGSEKGTVRLYIDKEDITADLEAACLEVAKEDPLGAYAVEYITYSISSVVAYTEATVNITYRRTKEQVDSIVRATGITAIRSELASAMSGFKPECVLRISYFDRDEAFIQELAKQAYYNVPAYALGMPELQVTLYPGSGQQRIVEILLTYPLEREELEQRQATLSQQLDQLAQSLATASGDARFVSAAKAVFSSGRYRSDGGSTAYDLLNDGAADSEGFALTMAALCQRLNLSCRVVWGTQNGTPHFWNLVQTQNGWRHVDLTASSGESFPFYTDQQMQSAGYDYDESLFSTAASGEEGH